jgi:hypothetical protein
MVLTKADKEVIADPQMRILLSQAFYESYRQGAKAGRETAQLLPRPWGFELEDVKFERIFLWHGEQDRMMPIEPAKLLAQSLPICTARYYINEGHLSLLANHAQEIFSTLRA